MVLQEHVIIVFIQKRFNLGGEQVTIVAILIHLSFCIASIALSKLPIPGTCILHLVVLMILLLTYINLLI